MPELCEVTIMANQLTLSVHGCTVVAVDHSHWYQTKRVNKKSASDFTLLKGWTFSQVTRHGKALLFKLENPGIGTKYIASRLGMSGSWRVASMDYDYKQKNGWAAALDLSSPQGHIRLVYSDLRQFGSIEIGDTVNDLRSLKIYGPEILSSAFTIEWVRFALSRHKTPVKALLLEQRYFAGLGNWLASEILFRANINPQKPAKNLTTEEIQRLFQAIHLTIIYGINQGGASLMSWKHTDGEEGEAQDFMLVYGRDEQDCSVCGSKIEKVMIAGRGTYYCPKCQSDDWQPPEPVAKDFVEQVIEAVK